MTTLAMTLQRAYPLEITSEDHCQPGYLPIQLGTIAFVDAQLVGEDDAINGARAGGREGRRRGCCGAVRRGAGRRALGLGGGRAGGRICTITQPPSESVTARSGSQAVAVLTLRIHATLGYCSSL